MTRKDFMDVKTVDTNERCKDCGQILQKSILDLGSTTQELIIKCSCQREREAEERRQRAQRGRAIIIRRQKDEAGLKLRQRQQTFDSFTPVKGQEAAYNACKTFAEQFGQRDSITEGLLLVGSVGSGKTHLAAAIANKILDNWDIDENEAASVVGGFVLGEAKTFGATVKFSTVISLLEEIRGSFGNAEADSHGIIKAHKRAGVLILDDLGAEKPTDWAIERLFEIIDHRYNELLPTVITTNLQPKLLKTVVGERIFDRIREMCPLVSVTSPSQRKTAV